MLKGFILNIKPFFYIKHKLLFIKEDIYTMQYIKAIVNTKTNELKSLFTYSVLPKDLAYIKIGSLIEVPFRNFTKTAIVYELCRSINSDLKTKIKPIKRVLTNYSVISKLKLNLAEEMSKLYLANLSKAVFQMIPKMSIKTLKKSHIEKDTEIFSNKHDNIFTISDYKEKRLHHYEKLISECLKKNKSVNILFSDFTSNQYYIKRLKQKYKNFVIVIDPTDSLTEESSKWFLAQNEIPRLIIGTRHNIFNISNQTGLIIIDEPENYGYKEEQNIHFETKNIAYLIAKISSIKIVFGSNYFESTKHNELINNQPLFFKKNISIINASNDKDFPIGYKISEIIQKSIEFGQKTLMLCFDNADASGAICRNCEQILSCNRCNHVYKTDKNNSRLYCKTCKTKIEMPKTCPNCNGTNFAFFGLTTKKIYQKLHKLFPENKIMLLDENYPEYISCGINISDNKILDYKNLKFDNLVVISWKDWQFFANQENYYLSIIRKLFSIAEIASNIYIQTNFEDDLLEKIVSKKTDKLLKEDMRLKKINQFPPYYQIYNFTFKDKIEKVSHDHANNLYQKIILLIDNTAITKPYLKCKKRDKYYYSLELKIKNNEFKNIQQILLKNYKQLELSKAIIDLDFNF